MGNFTTTLVLGAVAVAAWIYQPFSDSPEQQSATSGDGAAYVEQFSLCDNSLVRDDCVVDGDTFWLNGQKIRIAGIDTPETHPARCAYEQEVGTDATYRLQELLSEGAIRLHPIDRDRDRYGRLLRNVSGPKGDVGQVLIDEGLARPYAGGRQPWC